MPSYTVHLTLSALIPWTILIAQSVLIVIVEAARSRQIQRKAPSPEFMTMVNFDARLPSHELLSVVSKQGASNGK